MNEQYILNVEKCISISPSKVSITNQITKSYKNSLGYWEYKERPKVSNNNNSVKRKFHEFNISINSQRKLRQKIEYLFLYAKPRNIITYNGKKIPSFKVCFLTLTLPSKQIHNSGTIITTILDDFLQVLRKRLGMKNYVWRLEFQSNGNIHFHICTDTYVDYYFALRHWNKSLNKLGYVDRYSSEMSKLSFLDYSKRFGKNYKGVPIDRNILLKRYQNGVKTKWNKPNTVDVKNAKSKDSIGFYISKYFSKNEKGCKCNQLDNEGNSFAIRLCFWSRSLSRLSPESISEFYYEVDVHKYLLQDESVNIVVYDYCTVIYFDLHKLKPFIKDYLKHYFNLVKNEAEYIPA